ncbi:hypothetical protein, partial [Pseudomonas sp. MWU12-2323]|uniref:hypothetical protein n=1 Tax=Pseudomonas sp. MWU12-2323 TaxID=2651296 RepID=UPI001C49A7D8
HSEHGEIAVASEKIEKYLQSVHFIPLAAMSPFRTILARLRYRGTSPGAYNSTPPTQTFLT